MSAKIDAIGLDSFAQYLQDRPEIARRAAKFAINDVASRKAVPQLRRKMQEQVNFPAGYLNSGRFGVTRAATDTSLTATITARFRPTSLARFADNQSFEGARRVGGVRVRVKKGGSGKFVKGGFFVRLRRGKDTADGFNVGLALRLAPGQMLRGRRKGAQGVQLAPNLYLLYGPSVDQVFQDVAATDSPAIAAQLEQEFIRQWIRLNATTK